MENSILLMILLQVFLILLNAVFASAEIAVISINDAKLARMAAEGDKRAVRLARLTSQPARFLATIQVAITLSGFLGSAFAAENFSDGLVNWLVSLGVGIPAATLDAIAVVIITLILSYFTLIFGELVPKRVAMRKAESLALGISGLISAIAKLFAPIVWFLTASTNAVLRLLGIDPNAEEETVSEEEIRMMVDVGEEKSDKPGNMVDENAHVEVRGHDIRYVSRGGLKLEKAMQCFPLTPNGKVCMDIGASTGGFTDCMLQNGAKKVYAVDVGYGQLAWKLRNDERVVNLERCNFRHVTKEQIADEVDFASADVAFISLKLILPPLRPLLRDGGEAVCLIKPQFEAGKDKVGKKGVVRELSTHVEVIENTVAFMLESGFSVLGLDFSPIKGPQGNIEYLAYIKKSDAPENFSGISPRELAEKSHQTLDKQG